MSIGFYEWLELVDSFVLFKTKLKIISWRFILCNIICQYIRSLYMNFRIKITNIVQSKYINKI